MPAISTAAELVRDVESRIGSGLLLPGERLDPVRLAALDLNLAPNTVARAYRTLMERGLVVGRGRAGTFVVERRPSISVEPVVPEGIVDLATGNPDPALLPDLRAALDAIVLPTTLYGDVPVVADFEQSIRAHMVDLDGSFAAVSGALDGIERALAAHLRPGDRVGVETPGWPAVPDLLRAMLLRPVPIAIDHHGPIKSELEAVVDDLDAVIVTSRVQNPTGACVSAERARALTAVLDDHPNLLVVEDDHAGAISGVDLSPIGPGRRRWAISVSMSKTIGPDLRVAGLYGDPETISSVQSRQSVGPGWVSHLLQTVAGHLIDQGGRTGAFDRASATYRERRQRFVRGLGIEGIDARADSGLNVWVDVPDPGATVAACLESGYAIRSGDGFVLDDRRGVRVTTAAMANDNDATAVSRSIAGSIPGARHVTRAG